MTTSVRGRPRSAQVDAAILEAARALLASEGYARMTVEAVAARAGVGKAAIYRRYPGKPDLAAAAVAGLSAAFALPDTGSVRGDALTMLREFRGLMERFHGLSVIGTMLAEQAHNPELLERFRERVILPRRAMMQTVLRRGVERGELRADADLELVSEMLVGSYFARHLAGLPVPRDWGERVVDMVLGGLAVGPPAGA
jgi:AcrR family transcriptional regulator